MDPYQMAAVATRYFRPGMLVNLGVGYPTYCSSIVGPDSVVFHAENGVIGYGELVTAPREVDPLLVNANLLPVKRRPGMCFVDCEAAFNLIRSGRVDISVMGALQVSARGDLGNIWIPGRPTGQPGGAVDLAYGAKTVIVMMEHMTREGKPRIVRELTVLPTARECVDVIVTDLALIEVRDGELYLIECFDGWTYESLQSITDADLHDATMNEHVASTAG